MTDRKVMRQAHAFSRGSASMDRCSNGRKPIVYQLTGSLSPPSRSAPPESDGTESGGAFFSSNAEISLYRLFTEIAPSYGYKIREQQMRFATEAYKTIQRRGILLSDIGLGVGKTDAYLAAAILAKRSGINNFWVSGKYPDSKGAELPVVISTSSIALQNAVSGDYIPRLSKMMTEHRLIDRPVSCAVRKGKEHYICARRLQACVEDASIEELPILAPLMEKGAKLDLDTYEGLTGSIKRRISVAGNCSGTCRMKDNCRYLSQRAYMEKPEHDFQVCNHNYLLADLIRRMNGERPLLPDYQCVVIDEAHQFLAAAREMFELSLEQESVLQLVEDVRMVHFQDEEDGRKIHRAVDTLAARSESLFRNLSKRSRPFEEDDLGRLEVNISDKALRSLTGMRECLNKLEKLLPKQQPVLSTGSAFGRSLRTVKMLSKAVGAFIRYREMICWMEQSEGCQARLCGLPKDLERILRKQLWHRGIPIILTSGTLAGNGSFKHVKMSLGIKGTFTTELQELCIPSVFDHRTQMLLYLSENTQYPDNQNSRYLESIAEEILKLTQATAGRTLVLFTSYRAMHTVEELVRAKSKFPLFLMERNSSTTLEQFKASGNGVLFAAGSLWEGIDIPGNIVSSLIIVRLPFQAPTPVSKYMQSRFSSIREYMEECVIPDMLCKLKQGVGRLIRSEEDIGVVAILDSRVGMKGAYRKAVLEALPQCEIASNIAQISVFLSQAQGVSTAIR